jgi:hypothetical protein
MQENERAQRAAVVAEARSWLSTPYHAGACLKGVGVDCGQILIAIYSACGLCDSFDPGFYSQQWALHRDAERYLNFVRERATEIAEADVLPGDFCLIRFGRTFSHSVIVIDWPRLGIHATSTTRRVEYVDPQVEPAFRNRLAGDAPRERVFFTLWPPTARPGSTA